MKFEVSCFIEDGLLTLMLDDEIIVKGSGRFSKVIEKGSLYRLKWIVKGRMRTSFSISVSSPQLAEFHMSKTIGMKGGDLGVHEFEI